jgi:hypothetical protein
MGARRRERSIDPRVFLKRVSRSPTVDPPFRSIHPESRLRAGAVSEGEIVKRPVIGQPPLIPVSPTNSLVVHHVRLASVSDEEFQPDIRGCCWLIPLPMRMARRFSDPCRSNAYERTRLPCWPRGGSRYWRVRACATLAGRSPRRAQACVGGGTESVSRPGSGSQSERIV